MPRVSETFAREMKESEEFNATACMNCGICTALCPLEREVLPRKLFRYVLMGLEEEVKEQTPMIYSCLLCRMCENNCPAGVRIAENIRCLRSWINKKEFNL